MRNRAIRVRERSHHTLLRIVDAAIEASVRRPAVEREREVAERIGGVRAPVVHRARPQRLQAFIQDFEAQYSSAALKQASALTRSFLKSRSNERAQLA
jgi:hypothetical protein